MPLWEGRVVSWQGCNHHNDDNFHHDGDDDSHTNNDDGDHDHDDQAAQLRAARTD